MFFHSTRSHRTTAVTTSSSRRQSIARQRSGEKPTRRFVALKSGAQIVTAAAAAGLLLATYILPAYADQGSRAVDSRASLATQGAQTFAPDVTEAVASVPTSRDGYSVTQKPKVVVSRYSRVFGDFANNPNNLIIQWPFSQGVPIASGFGPRASPCGGCSSYHEGLDMLGGLGTPIQIIADGVVSKVGNPSGSYGVYAVIDHLIDGQRVSSLYGHMLGGSLTVAVGDQVKKGQIVGNVGSTGASSGPHLHLSIYLDGTVPIDPWVWMKQKVGS